MTQQDPGWFWEPGRFYRVGEVFQPRPEDRRWWCPCTASDVPNQITPVLFVRLVQKDDPPDPPCPKCGKPLVLLCKSMDVVGGIRKPAW